jgi:predicted enzyme related to lactoylglutathione lyase
LGLGPATCVEDTTMDHTIVHFEIPADDPERAARFYRDLFGWKIDKYEGSTDQRENFE